MNLRLAAGLPYCAPMSISSAEAAFYRSASVDPATVGDVLGSGAQNLVRSFRSEGGHQRVIKAPLDAVRGWAIDRIASVIVGQTREAAENELSICKMYFGDFMPSTEIRATADGKRFVLIQDRVDFIHITPAIVETSRKVRDQLKTIVTDKNADLLREQEKWIDAMGMNVSRLAEFLGPDGTPYMDNIVLEKGTGKVRVIDTGLFGLGPAHILQFLLQCENARRFGVSFGGQ